MSTLRARLAEHSIWVFAFGYFAGYIPYSFLTKVVTRGYLPSLNGHGLDSFSILPVSIMASAIGMIVFLSAIRWWKHATHRRILGFDLPAPTRWTFLSGLCTALIIATTTLAYTFQGVSIVFAMLLMRGGVLIIAPVVDALTGRHVRWFSWAGLGCAMAALLVSLADTDNYIIPALCAVDIAIYLTSYFIRLRFMSRLAKSGDGNANLRYFVEEQMVAAPAMVLLLGLVALFGHGAFAERVRFGFTGYWDSPVLLEVVLVGLFSQCTGIFGSLIFLDKRENTFCVPVNRSSSVLAGIIASYLLTIYSPDEAPAFSQMLGAAFILVAIVFLTIPPMVSKRRARLALQAA